MGRRVFANLRKAIVFMLAVHVPIVGLSLLPVLLGWPMLLMPVHIVFLELSSTRPARSCSRPSRWRPMRCRPRPRPPGARLFDRAVIARGLWQGGALLLLLLGLFALARWHSGSDDMARALTFGVLVLCNLALIHVNRFWTRASWQPGGPMNAAFGWIALATVVLLAIVLWIPAVGRLFAFVQPTPALLAAGLCASLLALLWFEAVKWRLSTDRRQRS